jgi:hypothetical protein
LPVERDREPEERTGRGAVGSGSGGGEATGALARTTVGRIADGEAWGGGAADAGRYGPVLDAAEDGIGDAMGAGR